MADPIGIIGTAGALANIIDVLGKVINTVSEYRRQWKEADLAALNLESQLAALSTALSKIKQWADSSFQEPHHQVVIDLDRCILCCRALIGKIDIELSQFEVDPQNQLDVASKFRLLLKTRDFEHIQGMIEQQTSALTLLLVACNTIMLSEQKGLLEEPQTRKIFEKMQDDTASLYVHRDVDSLITATATSVTSSKRSLHFDFDAELFISRIYEKWIRGSVKKSLQTQQSEVPCRNRTPAQDLMPEMSVLAMAHDELAEQKKRSRGIDKGLDKDSERLRREVRVLVLGDGLRTEILKHLKKNHAGGFSEEELCQYKSAIKRSIYDSAKDSARAMRQFGTAPEDDPVWEHVDVIAGYGPDPINLEISRDSRDHFVKSVEALLASPLYSELKGRRSEPGVCIDDSTNWCVPASYFPVDPADHNDGLLAEIGRITRAEYLPTEMDILRTNFATATGIWEHRFQMRQLGVRMFDIGHHRSEKIKWIHCFENVTTILFVADLACYDQVLSEDSSQNRMTESLVLFDSVVNSQWFKRSSVILFLANTKAFGEKLESSPVRNYFPDYSGGDSVNTAAEYFFSQFSQLNRARLDLYPRLVEARDPSNIAFVFDVIKETILNRSLRMSNIIK